MRVYVFGFPLNVELLIEPAAYWVHRLNAFQLGNTSLHTCNGFFGFINLTLVTLQKIFALLGSKRLNVAALTTIKTVVNFLPQYFQFMKKSADLNALANYSRNPS